MKSIKSLMVYTAVLGSFGLLLRLASMELRYRAYFATRKAGGRFALQRADLLDAWLRDSQEYYIPLGSFCGVAAKVKHLLVSRHSSA